MQCNQAVTHQVSQPRFMLLCKEHASVVKQEGGVISLAPERGKGACGYQARPQPDVAEDLEAESG